MLYLLALFVVITLLPLLRTGIWWIRVWDFPRVHIFLFGLIVLILSLNELENTSAIAILLIISGCIALVLQAFKIMPFTHFYPSEVKTISDDLNSAQKLQIYIANVQVENSEYGLLNKQVESKDPDIIVLVETDAQWNVYLEKHLSDKYPFSFKAIRDKGHGMGVWSKHKLLDGTVHHLVSDERPSLSMTVQTPSNLEFFLWVVHPAPPGIMMKNDERKGSRPRDAELLIVAKKLENFNGSVVVAGDFNDTGWSRTTEMFKQLSGLGDPRVGRGFYNTYPAHYPLIRYPIDHIFVSTDFQLSKLSRLGDIGSDHFPMLASLVINQVNPSKQQTEVVSSSETEKVIKEGRQEAKENERIGEK